jgi:hypothetical protein
VRFVENLFCHLDLREGGHEILERGPQNSILIKNLKPSWIISVHLIKRRRRGKNKSFLGMDASGRLVGTRKGGMRVYMVDVFCIHI